MAKGNKHPRASVVNIPSQFLPLIEKEREDKGLFSTTEMMGQILRAHYSEQPNGKKSTALKGAKYDED